MTLNRAKLLEDLINQRCWRKVVAAFSPDDLTSSLSFEDAVLAVAGICGTDWTDVELQQFAVSVMELLQVMFPTKWNSDWRHDVLLGACYQEVWEYDKRYSSYMRAYEKSEDPPPALLARLAACRLSPGTPPVTESQAERWLLQAYKKRPCSDVACQLRAVYSSLGDEEAEEVWRGLWEELEAAEQHMKQEELEPLLLRSLPQDERLFPNSPEG